MYQVVILTPRYCNRDGFAGNLITPAENLPAYETAALAHRMTGRALPDCDDPEIRAAVRDLTTGRLVQPAQPEWARDEDDIAYF